MSSAPTFGFLISDLARLIAAEFDRRIAAAGLGITAGEARTLVHAARAGAVRQAALAAAMGIEAMTVTGYLDRLEARGLVARTGDPQDRRAKLVIVSAAAEPTLAGIRQITGEIAKLASTGVPQRDWRALLGALETAHRNLSISRAEARSADSP